MFVLLLASVYMLHPANAKEAFTSIQEKSSAPESTPEPFIDLESGYRTSGYSSTTIYKGTASNNQFNASLRKVQESIDDRNDVLKAYRCYQMPPISTDFLGAAAKRANLYHVKFSRLTFSMDDIKSEIINQLLNIQKKLKNKPIQGHVFAFITQAPRYQDEQGREMVMQFTINDYLDQPFNSMKADAEPLPIFVSVALVFTGYDKMLTPLAPRSCYNIDNLNVMGKRLSSMESRDKLCFINCPRGSTAYPTYCGCATGNSGRANSQPYNSTCLGPTSDTLKKNPDKVTKSTFMWAYQINTKHAAFFQNRTFG